MPRTILHCDLDAFYASVEALDDPSLRGRPVIVAGDVRRGVVCAASYEARRYGVHSAMPTAQARRLCPDGVFRPPRFERYEALSAQVMGIFHRYTPLVEPLSLDEAFLDVTASQALFGSGGAIARGIKTAVRGECGLTISAGVADVKFAAKIASDLGKPDGLVEVPPGGVPEFLAPLPLKRLWGVGPVTERELAGLGLQTIGDLARQPRGALAQLLGAHGEFLEALARGEDPRAVTPDDAARSIGGEDTFEHDLVGRAALAAPILAQSRRVAQRLRAAGLAGRTITLKIKYADFELCTRRCTLPRATDDGRAIYEAALEQLERTDLHRPVRLTGISVSGLTDEPTRQCDLFEDARAREARRRGQLNAALDAITARFGDEAVVPADLTGHPRRR
ncbi:MAG TPA: DNA polymerase IV [Polyangia bacterium]